MSVMIIDDETLKRLNEGKTVDLEFGPLSATIASNKWVNRMKETGNLIVESCDFCSDLSDKGPFYDKNYILSRDNRFDIMADTGDSFQWGCVKDIKYCPYCGGKLRND